MGFLLECSLYTAYLLTFLHFVVLQRGQFPWLSKKCTCLGTPSTSSRTTSKTGSSCFLISSDFCFLCWGGEMEIFWILSLFGQVLLNSSIFWELPVYLHLHLLPLWYQQTNLAEGTEATHSHKLVEKKQMKGLGSVHPMSETECVVGRRISVATVARTG